MTPRMLRLTAFCVAALPGGVLLAQEPGDQVLAKMEASLSRDDGTTQAVSRGDELEVKRPEGDRLLVEDRAGNSGWIMKSQVVLRSSDEALEYAEIPILRRQLREALDTWRGVNRRVQLGIPGVMAKDEFLARSNVFRADARLALAIGAVPEAVKSQQQAVCSAQHAVLATKAAYKSGLADFDAGLSAKNEETQAMLDFVRLKRDYASQRDREWPNYRRDVVRSDDVSAEDNVWPPLIQVPQKAGAEQPAEADEGVTRAPLNERIYGIALREACIELLEEFPELRLPDELVEGTEAAL